MTDQKYSFSGSKVRTAGIYALFSILVLFWTLQPLGLRAANCISSPNEEPVNCQWRGQIELGGWVILLILIGWELFKSGHLRDYLHTWKRTWVAIPLLAMAILSTAWSNAPLYTLERALFLLAASMTIIFILLKNEPGRVLDRLTVFYTIVIVTSYLIVFLNPQVGRMLNPPYYGAWRGIFWHRNYLGSFMAFGSTVYLFRLLFLSGKGKIFTLLSAAGVTASTGLVVGSRSGAGILTLAMLTGLTLVIFLWTKIRSRMKTWHYWATGVAAIILAIAVLTNLDFIFGLVNRNTSLTGRIPLWQLLYQEYISKRLLFGYGMNAFWAFESVRTGLQSTLRWGYPVLIGDNGLVDIILHLGIVGAIVMIGIILFAFYHSGKYAFTVKTGMAFLPVIGMVFVVMSNISLSMLLELEYFVWALVLFAILVSNTPLIDNSPTT